MGVIYPNRLALFPSFLSEESRLTIIIMIYAV
jgi:hypothetical protein